MLSFQGQHFHDCYWIYSSHFYIDGNDFCRNSDSNKYLCKVLQGGTDLFVISYNYNMIPGYATILMQPNEIPLYMFIVPILNTISPLR